VVEDQQIRCVQFPHGDSRGRSQTIRREDDNHARADAPPDDLRNALITIRAEFRTHASEVGRRCEVFELTG
jgi:hypothetical protein